MTTSACSRAQITPHNITHSTSHITLLQRWWLMTCVLGHETLPVPTYYNYAVTFHISQPFNVILLK